MWSAFIVRPSLHNEDKLASSCILRCNDTRSCIDRASVEKDMRAETSSGESDSIAIENRETCLRISHMRDTHNLTNLITEAHQALHDIWI